MLLMPFRGVLAVWSVAGCLHSVGYYMPRVCNVMPMLDVIVKALTAQLQTWAVVLVLSLCSSHMGCCLLHS